MRLMSGIIFIVMPLLGASTAEGSDRSRAVQDLGVSDAYVLGLGTAAESFLIGRLEDSRFARYSAGTLERLANLGGIDTPNRRIVAAAKRFVESNCLQAVDGRHVLPAMAGALGVIGARCTDDEVGYLLDWIQTEKMTRQKNCFMGDDRDPRNSRELLRRGAVEGLGYCNNPRARAALEEVRLSQQSFLDRLNMAIDINEKAQIRGGLRAVFPSDRAAASKIRKDYEKLSQ